MSYPSLLGLQDTILAKVNLSTTLLLLSLSISLTDYITLVESPISQGPNKQYSNSSRWKPALGLLQDNKRRNLLI